MRIRDQSSSEKLRASCGPGVRELVLHLVLLGLTASLVSCVEIVPRIFPRYHVIQPSTNTYGLVQGKSWPTVFLGTGEGEVCGIATPIIPQPFLTYWDGQIIRSNYIGLVVWASPLFFGTFPATLPQNAFEAAVRQAVTSKKGTGLVGFTSDLRVRVYLLFAEYCVRVKGMVVSPQ